MKIFTIIAAFLIFQHSEAILGGDETTLHQFPFMAALNSRLTGIIPRFRLCGGSVISRSAILTCAYCVTGMTTTTLYIGAYTIDDPTEQYQLSMMTPQITITAHPGYVANTRANDIAIVKMPTPIGFFNHAVNIIYLPVSPNIAYENVPAFVMGYGQDTWFTPATNRLMKANTQTIPNASCNPSYATITATQMCTDTADSGVCVGDEGGPLVILRNGKYVQIGIIQVISDTSILGACRTGNKVYTRVTSFLDWIKANM